MFGLHPNAEIGYLTNWTASIFEMILSLGGGDGGGGCKNTRHTVVRPLNLLCHRGYVVFEGFGWGVDYCHGARSASFILMRDTSPSLLPPTIN